MNYPKTRYIAITNWLYTYCKRNLKLHPFGSCISSRGFTSAAYRYGFNGKEKETDGTADNYDFGARIYDGRLGRWLAGDPHFFSYSGVSNYCGLNNAPLIIIDPDGQDIVNGHKERLENAKNNVKAAETQFAEIKEKLGETRSEWRKYAKANGRSIQSVKKTFNSYKEIVLAAKEEVVNQTNLMIEMESYIKNFEKQSPKMFSLMNSLEFFNSERSCASVDIVLTFENVMPADYLINSNQEATGGLNPMPSMNSTTPSSIEKGRYKWSIIIETDPNKREIFESIKEQDILKHELGHAWYILNHFEDYQAYRRLKNDDTQNGHATDDKSGIEADRWGKMKDYAPVQE